MGTAPHDLVLRLRALADPVLRRSMLARELDDVSPEALAMLLGYLVSNAAHEDVRAAWLDAVLVLLGPRPPLSAGGLAMTLERLAAHPGRAVLQFLGVDPAERRGPGIAGDPYALEEVAPGLRKAKARLRSRDLLRQIASDPDPSVIRILLENPFVGEPEAIRVASLRPQVAAMFLEVLASTRFGVRESVQAALVLNPWCPVRLGLALLPLLSLAHLGDVADGATLDERVREAARIVPRVRRRG